RGAAQERVEYQFSVCGDKQTVVHVLNGDKGWNQTREGVEEMDEQELKEVQEQAWASWLTLVFPLLEEDVKLTSLDERKVEGRPSASRRRARATATSASSSTRKTAASSSWRCASRTSGGATSSRNRTITRTIRRWKESSSP